MLYGEYYAETVSRIKSSLAKIEAGDFDYLIPSLSTRGFDMAGFLYVSREECVVSFLSRVLSHIILLIPSSRVSTMLLIEKA